MSFRQALRHRAATLAIIVAALGYFVDIYDLLLFSIVRVESLKGLGVPDEQILDKGLTLINCQMAGLILGGFLWGILGDKRGRLSVLFGSIVMYSIANILNGFAQTFEHYAVLRFVAGIGLAGELGAGITLVAELMPKHLRGYGTTLIASFGVLGAVVAGLVGDYLTWRVAYIVGGSMGILVLLLRVGVHESGLFQNTIQSGAQRGQILIFKNWIQFKKLLAVILIGVPIWFVIGILVTLAPEFGTAMKMETIPVAGKAVMFSYLGLSIGDMASGLLCQLFKSRKKVVVLFLVLTTLSAVFYFTQGSKSLTTFYGACLALGFGVGYWAVFVTVAAEQFGTNIRATATTLAPNLVRGSLIPVSFIFSHLKDDFGLITGAAVVGLGTVILALIALATLPETFHRDLDFLESGH